MHPRFQNENNLFDAVVVREIVVANLDVHQVFLAEVQNQFLNFLRPGCGEEQSCRSGLIGERFS